MGCQCVKANEKSNMDLENEPPKFMVETVPVRAVFEEKERVEELAVKYILNLVHYYTSY